MKRTAALVAATLTLLVLPAAGASADDCVGTSAGVNGRDYSVNVCTTERDGCTQAYAKIDGQIGPFGALYTTHLPDCP